MSGQAGADVRSGRYAQALMTGRTTTTKIPTFCLLHVFRGGATATIADVSSSLGVSRAAVSSVDDDRRGPPLRRCCGSTKQGCRTGAADCGGRASHGQLPPAGAQGGDDAAVDEQVGAGEKPASGPSRKAAAVATSSAVPTR